MGKLYSLISTLLIAICSVSVFGQTGYEWWFDNDVLSRHTGTLSGNRLELQVDMSGLSEGLHGFNCRIKNDDTWGSIYHKTILIPVANPKTNPKAEAYEYWIDDNIGAKVSGSLAAGANAYVIDVQALSEGLHRLNYRVRTQYGDWSSIYCQYFCNVEKKPEPSEVLYEYWFDAAFSSRKKGTLDGDQMSFNVDASGLDETKDFHLFNMRVGDNVNGWGSIYQKILIFNDHKDDDKVVGYRHRVNGIDLGYVEVEGGLTGSRSFMVDLPEDLGITPSYNGNLTFDGNKISMEGSDSIHYSIQVKSGNGWSAPRIWDFAMSRSFSATAVEMAVNSSYQFDAPKVGEFAAVKFTSVGTPLYFRSDVPMSFDLYRNGEKIREFSVEEMEGLVAAELEAGEYFGILHDIVDSEAAKFTFHLMDTPNAAPNPVITFEEGTVTITCSRDDVKIYYTLDASEPTTESSQYEAPFKLNRNALVKARAFVPNSDINPSDVVTFVVNSFYVDTPYGKFNSESRMLVINCDTDGASIYYSFDREGEWQLYTAPIQIAENGIVYAMATLDGYNDSKVAEIVISDMKCASVSISYQGRYVTLETKEPNATIYYTTDGSLPSQWYEYTDTFDIKGLCTLKAIAIKSGYENSDVVELVIDRYADETHAETSAEGLLESAFEWNGFAMPENVDNFKVEGQLNDADYRFLNSNKNLRHLDIEKVRDAHIPDYAFLNSELISISLPSDLTEYGDSILSGAQRLSSLIWNSQTQTIDGRLADGLVNPNVLLFLPSASTVNANGDFNVVANGSASSITLHYGFPYYAAQEFHADAVSMTREFSQATIIGECQGWETIVLPFQPESITHAVNGPAVSFAAWDGNTEGMKPFWLYASTDSSEGWIAAPEIEACVPYIISMPNNPDYIPSANLGGSVTFSANNVNFKSESNQPTVTPWIDSSELEGTFLPVDEYGLLSLNVNDTNSGLNPGSTFLPDGITPPFGAYVRRAAGPKAMPLFGNGNGVSLPSVTGDGLSIETPAPGMLKISSDRELKVAVTTATGVTIRILHLKAGETVTLEGLTRDLYICAGVKVMVK